MTCTQLPTMLPPTLPALHLNRSHSGTHPSEETTSLPASRANHVSHKISAGDRIVCFNIVHGHRTNFFMSWPRLALPSCFCTPRRSSVVGVMLIFNIVQRSCAFNADPRCLLGHFCLVACKLGHVTALLLLQFCANGSSRSGNPSTSKGPIDKSATNRCMSLIRHCHTFEISARIKYQFVSTQIDVFNRVAQCTLVRRLTFEFVLMFDDEANTDSMSVLNVMQQIEEKHQR